MNFQERACLTLWMKDIEHLPELRKWFLHDLKQWCQFRERYGDELKKNEALLGVLRGLRNTHGKVTLVFAARDRLHNEAVIIREKSEKPFPREGMQLPMDGLPDFPNMRQNGENKAYFAPFFF